MPGEMGFTVNFALQKSPIANVAVGSKADVGKRSNAGLMSSRPTFRNLIKAGLGSTLQCYDVEYYQLRARLKV